MPRRIHRSGGRGPKDILDARREREADITFRPFVRPFGDRGLSYVKARGVDGEVLVSNAAGITFGPGAIVPVASHTGHVGEGEVIVGVPPPQQRAGAPSIFTSKTVPGDVPIPDLWRFGAADSFWYLDLYVGGEWDQLLATTARNGGTEGGSLQWIRTDPFGHVSDNSLLSHGVSHTSHTSCVWDVEGGVTYRSPSPSGGYHELPVYRDGWVYTILLGSGLARLYKARTNATTDGTTPGRTLVGSITWASPGGAGTDSVYADDEAYYVKAASPSGTFVKLFFDGTTPTSGHTIAGADGRGSWGEGARESAALDADGSLERFSSGGITAYGGLIASASPALSRDGSVVLAMLSGKLTWGAWPGPLTQIANDTIFNPRPMSLSRVVPL